MESVKGRSLLLWLALGAASLPAQMPIYPLAEVRPGLRGVGKTVFRGNSIEEFGVEILGVLENTGPKQSVILARLSGGPMEKTGVLQGMSGSPVYIDGRLAGAVALAFPFTREPIAGIRPIEEMLRESASAGSAQSRGRVELWDKQLTHVLPPRHEFPAGGTRLAEIATPISFGGFTRRTIEEFTPQLRALGLEPMQGVTGGGKTGEGLGDPSSVKPGAMISVLLLTGDMTIGADGTVTHVEGDRIYAFGHRFLSVGRTELPFARSEVLAVAPNLATSFKISALREQLGAITADYSTGVTGELGRKAAMTPVWIRVTGRTSEGGIERVSSYQLQMVDDRYLAPFLLQMAVYSAIDATERTLGAASVALRGRIELENGVEPVRLADVYAGDGNIAMQAALGAAVPVAYLLQSGFETALKVKGVSIDLDVFDAKRQWRIHQVWAARRTVRAGESVNLSIVLLGEDGQERIERVSYPVPVGAPAGPLYFTVADAMTTNLAEYQHLLASRQRTPSQVVQLLNELRSSTGVYVRAWRPYRSFTAQGRSLPAPPASVSLILGRGQAADAGASLTYQAKLAEIRLDTGDAAVTGSQTIQVEVKE